MSKDVDALEAGRGPQVVPSQKAWVIRFAGDSGDGIQLTGDRYAKNAALFGFDVVTLADFPAEIRAPQGTLYGVSGYQLKMGQSDIFTPGDEADVLVAMNAAALKTNLNHLRTGGILIVNSDGMGERQLAKAGFSSAAFDEDDEQRFRIFRIPLSKLTRAVLKDTELSTKEQERCKNFYALGLVFWLTNRSLDPTLDWLYQKFKNKPEIARANAAVLKAGYDAGEAREIFSHSFPIPAQTNQKQGQFRYMSGNHALALGLIAAAVRSGRQLFFGSYPITPASDILHELAKHREFPVTIFQAEDEIAAVGAAIGSSFAGGLGVTATAGPGFALKSEFMGLAVMAELPLVAIDVQRAGPSTGMPTKVEQTDLLMALWGRNGESPAIVLAPSSPSDCFDCVYEACRLAILFMSPVVVLSDGYLANGSEAWQVPDPDELPAIPNDVPNVSEGFLPYARHEDTLARPWVPPGTAGAEHRIGGLEKQFGTGDVCYEPENHERMVQLRADKIARVREQLPESTIWGPGQGGLLVLSWGSTAGAVRSALIELEAGAGLRLSHLHLRYLNPLPKDLGAIMDRFDKVLVPENNLGQLLIKLRAEYPGVAFEPYNKVTGLPFKVEELKRAVMQSLKGVQS